MSFDDDFAAQDLADIYDAFGFDGTIQRGADLPVPVRIVVDRDQAVIGEFNQVVARVDQVRVRVAQWPAFMHGDLVSWSDRLGNHAKRIERQTGNDGLEAHGVLHG